MKKIFAVFAVMLSLFLLASCSSKEKSSALTHDEYMAAEEGTTVTIEAYIQAKQSWWESEGVGQATFYLQDENGGYFVYNLGCTKADYDSKLTVGTKIQVIGQKTEWAGEIEIDGQAAAAEATYKILDAKPFVATAKDVTSALGTDNLVKSQNMLVSFKDLYVLPQSDGTSAFYYKWNGSGQEGDDLYVSFSDGSNVLSACVESYLCDKDSDVYKAVKALNVGDKVDLEGFLYWYEGAQPHLTKVTKNGNIFDKSSGTMTHTEYVNAETGADLVIEAFIQGKQSWWESEGVGVASFYLQDNEGGYFAYNLPCTEAQYNNELTVGTKVRISGKKTEWSGEHEVDGLAAGAEATVEVINEKKYIAVALDLTSELGKETLIHYQKWWLNSII